MSLADSTTQLMLFGQIIAMVRTVLHYMGLPEIKPGGGKWVDVFGFEHEMASYPAPGFGNIFKLD